MARFPGTNEVRFDGQSKLSGPPLEAGAAGRSAPGCTDVTPPPRSTFFLGYACLLTSAAVSGFVLNGLLRPISLPPATPLLVAHGLLMLAWYGALILQTALVRTGQTGLHRRLGVGSLAIVGGMLGTAVPVALGAYEPGSGESMVLPNAVMLLNFAGLYGLGLRALRRDLETHRRLMVLAGAALLGPSLGRICAATGAPVLLMPALWIGLLAPLWVYDWRRLARIHLATGIGSVCVVLLVLVAAVLSSMAPVQFWLDGLLG